MEQHKKNKKKIERCLSIFQILILLVSIATFSYFIGNEFQVVSAKGIIEGAVVNPPVVPEVSLPTPTPATPVPTNPIPDVSLPTPTAPVTPASSGVPLAEPVVPPATPATSSFPASWGEFGTRLLNSWTSIMVNAAIAAGLYYLTTWLGPMICPTCTANFINTLALTLSIGYGAGSMLGIIIGALGGNSLPIFGLAGAGFGLIGLGIGIILFLIFYRDVQISAVVFSCYPWQPQSGGANCDKCNKGEFPCTQYKCQSLGQSCELLNPGTSNEVCTWVDRNDIAPPVISSWDGPLDKTKYEYLPDAARLPPDKGVIIRDKTTSDGCITPFTQLYYGVTLDKPGTCKIDINRTSSFDNMRIPINNGYYLYNHTLLSIHAGANESAAEGVTFPNGGNYEVFVRCKSRNGYSNTGTFVFKYCVSDEPDTTPPTIQLTNPINGMPIQYGQTSVNAEVYTNKPADCRWSHNDEDYDTMAGRMTCAQSITEMNANMLYKCTTTLTGLRDGSDNNFYFRCKSYPNAPSEADRYKNEESYVYKLIGTRSLVIDSLSPQSGTTIKDATASVKVVLEAKTSAGYNNGVARCYFKKTSESDKNYVLFMNTNSYQNSQDLWLPKGSYRYSVNCCDLGGNCATKTTDFSVETDFQSPIVVRAYNEGSNLKIVTGESAECVYDTTSCSYNFDDGLKMTSSDNINHFTDWSTDRNFYIKCKDEFGNQPAPDGCSIVVRPFN